MLCVNMLIFQPQIISKSRFEFVYIIYLFTLVVYTNKLNTQAHVMKILVVGVRRWFRSEFGFAYSSMSRWTWREGERLQPGWNELV